MRWAPVTSGEGASASANTCCATELRKPLEYQETDGVQACGIAWQRGELRTSKCRTLHAAAIAEAPLDADAQYVPLLPQLRRLRVQVLGLLSPQLRLPRRQEATRLHRSGRSTLVRLHGPPQLLQHRRRDSDKLGAAAGLRPRATRVRAEARGGAVAERRQVPQVLPVTVPRAERRRGCRSCLPFGSPCNSCARRGDRGEG